MDDGETGGATTEAARGEAGGVATGVGTLTPGCCITGVMGVAGETGASTLTGEGTTGCVTGVMGVAGEAGAGILTGCVRGVVGVAGEDGTAPGEAFVRVFHWFENNRLLPQGEGTPAATLSCVAW